MKLSKVNFAAAAIALGLSLQSGISWSSRAYGPVVTGTVTASPASGTVEIDGHAYHVKPNSAAAKALSSLYVGEVVDVVLDGPPAGGSVEVISIVQHTG